MIFPFIHIGSRKSPKTIVIFKDLMWFQKAKQAVDTVVSTACFISCVTKNLSPISLNRNWGNRFSNLLLFAWRMGNSEFPAGPFISCNASAVSSNTSPTSLWFVLCVLPNCLRAFPECWHPRRVQNIVQLPTPEWYCVR